jgi:hypothetical protein
MTGSHKYSAISTNGTYCCVRLAFAFKGKADYVGSGLAFCLRPQLESRGAANISLDRKREPVAPDPWGRWSDASAKGFTMLRLTLSRLVGAGVLALATSLGLLAAAFAADAPTGPTLPFRNPPSASKAGPSLKESTHHWRTPAQHVSKDAPNVVVIMLDDVGFGQAGTYGGPINTPTLSRIAETGISFNDFHTTALCSPTRAALLTGRNHHHVGNGVITEMAADWDGYIGTIPQTTATVARVLTDYGYNTAAFGR